MDNLPPIPQPPSSSKTIWWIGGAILAIGIILFAFYLFRSTLFPPAPTLTPTPTSQRANPLFDTQSATVYGIITKITNSTVSITNNKGISGNFPVSDKVMVYTYNENPREASASSDLKTVELGKQASLFLELINGQYQVVSISYFTSLPAPQRKL